jgi:four helix bundle protein
MRNYKNYEVWRLSTDMTKEFYRIHALGHFRNVMPLGDQMLRSSLSIPSNIAEGAGRSSDKEFIRFLEIALGSLYEFETQLEISLPYINNADLLSRVNVVSKMLVKLIQSIDKSK